MGRAKENKDDDNKKIDCKTKNAVNNNEKNKKSQVDNEDNKTSNKAENNHEKNENDKNESEKENNKENKISNDDNDKSSSSKKIKGSGEKEDGDGNDQNSKDDHYDHGSAKDNHDSNGDQEEDEEGKMNHLNDEPSDAMQERTSNEEAEAGTNHNKDNENQEDDKEEKAIDFDNESSDAKEAKKNNEKVEVDGNDDNDNDGTVGERKERANAKSKQHEHAHVCLVLFTKDSPGMLRTWLNHHLALFDAPSITIVDHSSQSQDVLNQLSSFSKLGGAVHIFNGPFSNKALELSRIMRARVPHCDFLVPLDTDEMLAAHHRGSRGGSGLNSDTYVMSRRKSIENEFNKLKTSITSGRGRFKFGMVNNMKFCTQEACKGIEIETPGQTLTVTNQINLRALSFPPQAQAISDQPSDDLCQHKTFYAANVFFETDKMNMSLKSNRECQALTTSTHYYPKHHNLVIVHLNSATPHQWYRNKIFTAEKGYNFTSKTNCEQEDKGKIYCRVMQELDRDPGNSMLGNSTKYCLSRVDARPG